MTYSNDCYVDLESERWTKRLKQIAYAKFLLKMGILSFYIMSIMVFVEVLKQSSVCFKNPDIEFVQVWTNSQITALIVMLAFCYILIIWSRTVKKMMKF